MSDWAFFDSSRFAVGGTVAITGGGTVTANSIINTKGVWQNLVPSVPFDADIITTEMFILNFSGNPLDNFLVDIGKGTAGAEQIIASNLIVQANRETHGYYYKFPYVIGAGEALSARAQCSIASQVVSVGFHFESHGFAHFPSGSRMKTYGANASTSRSTMIPASSPANAKGSWTQIVNSTSEDICEILISLVPEDDVGVGTEWFLIDIGIGPAGSEKIIIPDLSASSYNQPNSNNSLNPCTIGPIPVSIPASSRIAVRMQHSSTFFDIGVIIVGISR